MPTNWTRIATIGSAGTDTDQLNGPAAIALDAPYMFIADYNNSRVLKWKMQGGSYVDVISSIKSNQIIVNEDYLYVMDITNDVIKKYNKHTLAHIADSAAFSELLGMTWWRDYIYAVDITTNYLYRIDPNTMSRVAFWDLSGDIGALVSVYDVCANGNHLFILASDGTVYRYNHNLVADGNSVDLSSYAASGWDYLSAQEDYIFVSSSSEDTFVVIDTSCQFIEDVSFDTTDWSSLRHCTRIGTHAFIAADFIGDQLVIMYGFDRSSGKASGDTITINDDGDWDFGDDIIIGGSEANLSTIGWVRADHAAPSSQHAWKEADY